MLNSPNIPDVPFELTSGLMNDLFRNFTLNWGTLSPVLWVLYGVLFGFFVLKLLKEKFTD
jgi:hypothetical protein